MKKDLGLKVGTMIIIIMIFIAMFLIVGISTHETHTYLMTNKTLSLGAYLLLGIRLVTTIIIVGVVTAKTYLKLDEVF